MRSFRRVARHCLGVGLCLLALIPAGVAASGAPLVLQATLIAPDGVAGEYGPNGIGVSDDGTTAIVGSLRHNNRAGAAYIYARAGGVWTLQTELSPPDAAAQPAFGQTVAISGDGDTAAVGASTGNAGAGEVYVYIRNGATWTQQAYIPGIYGANSDFGGAVALSRDGSTAAFGVSGKVLFNPQNFGAVEVFVRTGAVWMQQQELTASDTTLIASFGISVAVSADGNTVLGGQLNSFRPGGAFVFTRTGATWSQQAKLTGSDTVMADDFGDGVSLSSDGGTAVVAALGKNANTGAAYVFADVGGTWAQQQELTPSDGAPRDLFGAFPRISGDASTIAVGALDKAVNGVTQAGAVYLFTPSGGVWTQQQELTESNPNANDQLGVPLAVDRDGTTVIAGAEDRNGGVGAAFVFGLPAPSVAMVTPTRGLTVGGVAVTVAGTGFRIGAGVTFGGVSATNVVVVNDTTITATVPPHAMGAVDVVVINPDTQYGVLVGGFVYQPIPPPAPRPANVPPAGSPVPPMPPARLGGLSGDLPLPVPTHR